MNHIEPQSLSLGFVAWLDVLGYKQVLSSDQGAEAAEAKMEVWQKVLTILRRVREQQFEHGLTEHQENNLGLCDSSFKSTAFTDSIVLSVNLLGADEESSWGLETLFLKRTAFLSRLMFEEGLPIRGGIAFGHFIHSEEGFAGLPFVEAEALSSSLELSACVFTQTAIKQVRRIHENYPPWKAFDANYCWFRYDQCPVKSKPEPKVEAMYVLNFASRGGLKATNDASEFKLDLSVQDVNLNDVVSQSFGFHGKPIHASSIQFKIQETVKMLEATRQVCPSFFS